MENFLILLSISRISLQKVQKDWELSRKMTHGRNNTKDTQLQSILVHNPEISFLINGCDNAFMTCASSPCFLKQQQSHVCFIFFTIPRIINNAFHIVGTQRRSYDQKCKTSSRSTKSDHNSQVTLKKSLDTSQYISLYAN